MCRRLNAVIEQGPPNAKQGNSAKKKPEKKISDNFIEKLTDSSPKPILISTHQTNTYPGDMCAEHKQFQKPHWGTEINIQIIGNPITLCPKTCQNSQAKTQPTQHVEHFGHNVFNGFTSIATLGNKP